MSAGAPLDRLDRSPGQPPCRPSRPDQHRQLRGFDGEAPVVASRGDEYDIAAAFTVYQTDLEGQTRLFSVGQYLDTITFSEGAPRFREKIAIVDTFNIPNLLAIPL